MLDYYYYIWNNKNMENNSSDPAMQQAEINPQSHKSNQLLFVIIGILLLIIGLLCGYIFWGNNNLSATQNYQQVNSVLSPTLANKISPTTIPATTSNLNWETYTSTKLPNNSLNAYSIQYPSSWTAKNQREAETLDKLTLSKDSYIITIFQAAFGGSGCIFEGDIPVGPYADLRSKKFTQIESKIGTLRRYEADNSTDNNPNIKTFDFCRSKDGKSFSTPANIGNINYDLPKNYDESVLQEMDSILKTLREVK